MTDIRSRVAVLAAIATVALLSLLTSIGYVATVNANRQSQIDLLDERLDEFEARIVADGTEVNASTRLDLSLRVIREGESFPADRPNVLQVIRPSEVPGVEALVGRVSTLEIDQTLATVRTGLWISVFVIGLLVGAAAWIVVDRALSPVRRLTAQVRAIEADRSEALLPVDSSGDEIAELAATFNTMLQKLRAADSDRRRFVSDASHELRSPLMVLSAEAEFVLDHGGSATDLARSTMAQGDRLTALVDDLLTLASIDEGQDTTDQACSVQQVLVDADATHLTRNLDPVLARSAIPNISRSLANVMANAQRHKTSEVCVEVSGDADQVIIVVDDDGPGIPVSERAQVFRRFYRPDGSRTRADGGAGLGLAIAKAEIAQAGGTITITDSPAGGARFEIVVPRVGAEAQLL